MCFSMDARVLLEIIFVITAVLHRMTDGNSEMKFAFVGGIGDTTSGLFQINLQTGNSIPVVSYLPNSVIAVAYDPRGFNIFYSDIGRKTICKYSLLTGTDTTIYQETNDDSHIDGLAFDYVDNKLYYADVRMDGHTPVKGILGQIDIDDNTNSIVFMHSKLAPRAIQIDQLHRKLYFTSWGEERGVYSLSLDKNSKEVQRIVSTDIHWPNALAIDSHERVMYWADVIAHKSGIDSRIEMSNLDGSGRRVLLEQTDAQFYGFGLDSTYLYITDWKYKKVRRMHRLNEDFSEVRSSMNFTRAHGIVVSTNGVALEYSAVVADANKASSNLYQIDIKTGSTVSLLPSPPLNAVAVAYDPRGQNFYYSDVGRSRICKYSNLTGAHSVVYQSTDDSSQIEGLAFDGLGNKLYYTDSVSSAKGFVKGIIGSIDLTRKTNTILGSHHALRPRAVQTYHRTLYFTDWDEQPSIYKSVLDGSPAERIITTGLHWPNGLAIDPHDQVIYWADAGSDDIPSRIEMSDLDGFDRRVVLRQKDFHYYALALDPTYLYITSWNYPSILRLHRITLELSKLPSSRQFTRPSGIAVYARAVPIQPVTCSTREFRCYDGSCIESFLRCNRLSECPDGSDELNCEYRPASDEL